VSVCPRDVVSDGVYSYRIQAVLGDVSSELSPPLEYTHGQPFCGDGHVDRYSLSLSLSLSISLSPVSPLALALALSLSEIYQSSLRF
jgi:hypothetical protein